LPAPSRAQGASDWRLTPIFPKTTPALLTSVAVRRAHIVAGGESGTIVRSTDRGATWTSASTGGSATIRALAFVDSLTLIAASADGVMRSVDGGATWARVEASSGAELRGAAFGDARVGVIVGDSGIALVTTDGGAHWRRTATGVAATLRAVAFSSPTAVVAVGDDGVIIRSADGGAHWRAVQSPTSAALRGVRFESATRGVAAGGDDRRWRPGSVLLETTDGGEHWTRVASPLNRRLYGIAYAGAGVVAVGDSGASAHRVGGGPWIAEKLVAKGAWLSAIAGDADGAVAVGPVGTVLLRAPGDSAWRSARQGPLVTIAGIAMPSKSTVLIGSADILRSVDDFATSVKTKAPPKTRTTIGLAFGDSLHGVAVGELGQMLWTNDGGATWTKSDSVSARNLRVAAFVSPSVVVAVAAAPRPKAPTFRSTNGGRSWSAINSGTHAHLLGLAFGAYGFGVAVGGAGVIQQTVDSGVTWQLVPQGETHTLLRGVAILDRMTWVVVGDEGVILRTRDGGLTWSRIATGTLLPIASVAFSGTSGLVVGPMGLVLASDDAGVTWRRVDQRIPSSFFSIVLRGADDGFVGGFGGELYRLTRGPRPLARGEKHE